MDRRSHICNKKIKYGLFDQSAGQITVKRQLIKPSGGKGGVKIIKYFEKTEIFVA